MRNKNLKAELEEGQFVRLIVSNGVQVLSFKSQILEVENDFIKFLDLRYNDVKIWNKNFIINFEELPEKEIQELRGEND